MRRLIPLLMLGLPAMAASATSAPAVPYPLTTCIVMDEPLDSMGGAVAIVHEGREIKFCCRGCITRFQKDPAKFLVKLATPAATAAAKP